MYGVITKALWIAHPSLRLGSQINVLVFVTMQSVRPQHNSFGRFDSVWELTTLRNVLTWYLQALLRKIRCQNGCTENRFLCHIIEPVWLNHFSFIDIFFPLIDRSDTSCTWMDLKGVIWYQYRVLWSEAYLIPIQSAREWSVDNAQVFSS